MPDLEAYRKTLKAHAHAYTRMERAPHLEHCAGCGNIRLAVTIEDHTSDQFLSSYA